MKKTIIRKILMLAVIATTLFSCKEESPDYMHVIPADVSAIVGINIQSLSDKSGINDGDKQKMIDMMKTELNADAFKYIEKIIKNGTESGISMKDPVYFFTNDKISSAIVMKIDNAGKLSKLFELLSAEKIVEPLTKADGLNIAEVFNGGICAFDESTVLFADYSVDKETIVKLMKQKKEESILNSVNYKNMSAKKGDITFFVTLDVVPSLYKEQMAMQFDNIDLKDIGLVGGISFDKGKISFQMENTSSNEEFLKMMKQQRDVYGKIDETFLPYFPSTTLMQATINLKGEKFYNLLLENRQINQYFPIESIEKLKDVITSFDGDLSFGLTDFTMSEVPAFVVYAQAKNGAALEALYQSKDNLGFGSGEDIVKLGDNEYEFRTGLVSIYMGFKDQYLYATSSLKIKENIGKKERSSLKDAWYISNMKGKYQYVSIDIQSILNLSVVKMLAIMGGSEASTYLNIASKVSLIEATGNGDMQSELCISLTDSDTNALKQIVDAVKQFAGL